MKENLKLWVCVGKSLKPHGLKGHLKIFLETNCELLNKKIKLEEDSEIEYIIKDAKKVSNNISIISLSGINSIEKAENLSNKNILIKREDLSKEEYIIEELIDLEVFDYIDKNLLIGQIKSIENLPSPPVLNIKSKEFNDFLIPFNEQYIDKIDILQKKIFLKDWSLFLL